MSFSGSKSTNASRLGMLWACLRERRIVNPWMLAMIIFVFNEDEKLVSMIIESREDVWKLLNIRKVAILAVVQSPNSPVFIYLRSHIEAASSKLTPQLPPCWLIHKTLEAID